MIRIIRTIPKYICELPDRSTLRAKYPGEKGNQWTWQKNWLTETCIKLAYKADKKDKPILGFLNSGTDQCILSADFDIIPDHLNIEKDTLQAGKYWDSFAWACKCYYGHNALIGRSCSNKVKVMFVVRLPWKLGFNKEEQIMGLKQILLPRHFPLCDTSANSTNLTYLTPDLIDVLQDAKYLEPIDLILDKEYIASKSSLIFANTLSEQCSITPSSNSQTHSTMDSIVQQGQHTTNYHNYITNKEDIIPELAKALEDWNTTDNRTLYLKKMTAMWRLLDKKGFGISMKDMATDCGVSMESISRYIRYFIKTGLLKCINRGYVVGKFARTYIATGILRKAIRCHKQTFGRLKKFRRVFEGALPKSIPDTKWETTLYAVHYAFDTAKDYLSYVSKLPGYFKKDRKKKAERIAKRKYKDTG